jgi:hypothetical protein
VANFIKLDEQLKLPDPTAFLVGLNLNPHSIPYHTVRVVVVVVALPEADLCAKNARRQDTIERVGLARG